MSASGAVSEAMGRFGGGDPAAGTDVTQRALRAAMVRDQLARRGIADPRILAAMGQVPRERFVPEHLHAYAYDDRALRIEAGQTISQPYIVALMLDAAAIGPDDHVLEVGAGSGYAAAVLGRLARDVIAMERHAELADLAAKRVAALGCTNVRVIKGDGTRGAPDVGPFDAILVPAAGVAPPQALLDQVAPGGRLVMPVGGSVVQVLTKLTRRADGGFDREDLCEVAFVPLVGD